MMYEKKYCSYNEVEYHISMFEVEFGHKFAVLEKKHLTNFFRLYNNAKNITYDQALNKMKSFEKGTDYFNWIRLNGKNRSHHFKLNYPNGSIWKNPANNNWRFYFNRNKDKEQGINP